MERKTFDDCLGWLEKFHGKQVTSAVRQRWWETFAAEHDDIFCKAMFLHDERVRPGLFPTLEQMRRLVTDARELAWQKTKQAEPRRPLSRPDYPDNRNTERGRAWLAGIIDVLEGKISADELIARMAARI